MKVIGKIMLFLILSGPYAFAQFSGGGKAGIGLSRFDKERVATSYSGGVFGAYQLPFAKIVSLRTEVLYFSNAGTLNELEQFVSDDEYSIKDIRQTNRIIRYHAVEVPLLIQAELPFMDSKIYAGASYAYLFAASIKSDKTYVFEREAEDSEEVSTTIENSHTQILSSLKKDNVSALFGIEFAIDAGVPVLVDIRYQHGFTPLNRLKTFQQDDNWGDLKSRSLSISVGVILF